jgi:hypothetical protein
MPVAAGLLADPLGRPQSPALTASPVDTPEPSAFLAKAPLGRPQTAAVPAVLRAATPEGEGARGERAGERDQGNFGGGSGVEVPTEVPASLTPSRVFDTGAEKGEGRDADFSSPSEAAQGSGLAVPVGARGSLEKDCPETSTAELRDSNPVRDADAGAPSTGKPDQQPSCAKPGEPNAAAEVDKLFPVAEPSQGHAAGEADQLLPVVEPSQLAAAAEGDRVLPMATPTRLEAAAEGSRVLPVAKPSPARPTTAKPHQAAALAAPARRRRGGSLRQPCVCCAPGMEPGGNALHEGREQDDGLPRGAFGNLRGTGDDLSSGLGLLDFA